VPPPESPEVKSPSGEFSFGIQDDLAEIAYGEVQDVGPNEELGGEEMG